MTLEEFTVIAGAMKAVYTDPKFLPDINAIRVWYNLLNDLDNKTCQAAVARYITTKRFPPTVADIREMAVMNDGNTVGGLEAWAIVRKALGNGYYDAEGEFAKLPKEIQLAIGSPANIKEMSNMSIETLEAVEKGRFIHAYNAVITRKTDDAKIPPSIQRLIDGLTAEKQIPEKPSGNGQKPALRLAEEKRTHETTELAKEFMKRHKRA